MNRIEWTYGWWSFSGKIRTKEEAEKIDNMNNHIFKESREKVLLILWWASKLMIRSFWLIEPSIPSNPLNPFWWVKAYGDYNSNILLNLLSWDYDRLVEFDISNFYDNIRLDILENKVRWIAGRDYFEEVSLLFHFLNYWNRADNFYNKQTIWLPQDVLSECSRILAN